MSFSTVSKVVSNTNTTHFNVTSNGPNTEPWGTPQVTTGVTCENINPYYHCYDKPLF